MTQYANYGVLESIPIVNTMKTKRLDYILNEMENKLDLDNKEITVVMNDGSVIEGIVRETRVNEGIIIALNGTWSDKKFISNDEIKHIKVSKHPYYSFSHKRNLREQKKPRLEFRFNEEKLKSFIGKYVSINYDGKIIEGKIVKYKFKPQGPNEITIETTSGELKSIKDYRLRSLEIIGSNYSEYQGFKRLKDLEEELFIASEEEYSCYPLDCLENKVVEPDYLLEKYYEARISVLEGENIDLEKFNYNWIQEVMDRKEECPTGNIVDKSFYKDVKKARDVNEYYNLRKSFIDFVFNKVQEVNWYSYCKNQRKGEIDALKYIYESGIVIK